ncbi:MAG: helix-turn-helix domain-containing protein [Bacteroidetes bacterium]|nr:helix-turn-helix domain-containing protein [Bacteroidota bacterium]
MKDLLSTYSIGHFVNEPARRTDFEILYFEGLEEPDVDEIHKHAFYEIIWTEKGMSRQTIDYKEYEVRPGSLFFISPNQVHRFEEWKPLAGGSILFTEELFLLGLYNKDKLFELSFLDNFYTNPCLQLGRKDFADVKKTIDIISGEYKRKDRSVAIVQSLLHVLLAQVQRCIDNNEDREYSKKYLVLYKRLRELLEENFSRNEPVSFYAERLNITQHHLNLVVKSVTGKTAGQVIRERSMLEAKRLLTFSDYTVTEIASELGYFDSSYFSKLFRQETGQAANAFKKKMSEKYRIK